MDLKKTVLKVAHTLRKKNRLVHAFFAGVMVMGVAACSTHAINHGYVKDPDLLTAFEPGITTKQEIATELGSPSTRSDFGEDTWYYMHSAFEQTAFFKPEMVDQRVVAYVFDKQDVLTRIEIFTEDAAREIEVVDETTPTEGHSMTFMEQLLGNLGKFNKPRSLGPRNIQR